MKAMIILFFIYTFCTVMEYLEEMFIIIIIIIIIIKIIKYALLMEEGVNSGGGIRRQKTSLESSCRP